MKKSLAIAIFAVMALIIIGVGAYAWTLDSQLESAATSTSAYGGAAAGELAGALSELDEAMRESYYAMDSALQSTLCAKAAANAASAVTALASLPGSTYELELLSQYINGAGDYALYLAKETASGRSMTDEERETLLTLSEAVSNISLETGGIFAALDAGDLTLDDYGATLSEADGTVGAALVQLDAALDDFPGIEYDGKYSAAQTEAALLAGGEEVSESVARDKAAEFLGVERSALNPTGLTGGEVPCYGFEYGDGENQSRVYVTEMGGIVASLTGNCSSLEGDLDAASAESKAAEFLSGLLGGEFELVGSAENPGACALTFAPVENGVLLLPDAVSVTLDAATGEVCAYNAANYILNHAQRELPDPAVDMESAAALINPELTIDSVQLVLTRSDGGDEALCWEFNCSDGDGEGVDVFVDAQMGREVKIELAQA